MRIGVFDSGIGGLTILKELLTLRPNNHYIYYGDNKNLPYGNKTKDELTIISDNIIKYFISREVDLIIIACGTMSSIIDKSKYNIKIIDIIDPVINYLSILNVKTISLLGTTRTIDERVFKERLESLNIKVYDKACPKFPLILENKLNENIDNVIEEYLKEFKDISFDYVILGCTHFSLIEDKIISYLRTHSINIGKLIAREISSNNCESKVEIYFDIVDKKLKDTVKDIIGLDIDNL